MWKPLRASRPTRRRPSCEGNSGEKLGQFGQRRGVDCLVPMGGFD